MADGAFEVAFELPTVGAANLKYVWNEENQKGYIMSVSRAGMGVSGVLHEMLDLVPKPSVTLAYRQVSPCQTFVLLRTWHCALTCVFLHV